MNGGRRRRDRALPHMLWLWFLRYSDMELFWKHFVIINGFWMLKFCEFLWMLQFNGLLGWWTSKTKGERRCLLCSTCSGVSLEWKRLLSPLFCEMLMGISRQVMRMKEMEVETFVSWLDNQLSVMKVTGRLDQKMMMRMPTLTIATWQPTNHYSEASSNR